MSDQTDSTVRNASGRLEGYTNDYGRYVWGNPKVVAEESKRQQAGLEERLRRADIANVKEAERSRGRER